MQTITLTEQKWQQVMAIIAQAPWNVANPLLMEMGEQLRAQTSPPHRFNGPEAEEIKKPS